MPLSATLKTLIRSTLRRRHSAAGRDQRPARAGHRAQGLDDRH